MTKRTRSRLGATILFLVAAVPLLGDPWVTGYVAEWPTKVTMRHGDIDFDTFTHLIHFAVCPTASGGIDIACEGLTLTSAKDLVALAHLHSRKVLYSVNAAGSKTPNAWNTATNDSNISRFVETLLGFLDSGGYDGIDIDWEPYRAADAAQFKRLIQLLRQRINATRPGKLLTAAVYAQAAISASIHPLLDQMNVMTYDLAGPWDAPLSWHNSALFGSNLPFPAIGGAVGSVDRKINEFLNAGAPPAKLGLGLPFYGYVWAATQRDGVSPLTGPYQQYSGEAKFIQKSFNQIVAEDFDPNCLEWDTIARVPFLSIQVGDTSKNRFVTFDDPVSIKEKVRYALGKGLGGMMVWELRGDFFPALPAEGRHPLTSAINRELGNRHSRCVEYQTDTASYISMGATSCGSK